MLDISQTISDSLETKWSYINQFDVTFTLPQALATKIAKKSVSDTKITNIKAITGNDISKNIISVDTPQFSSQNIESFTGGKWYFHNGKTEMLRFSITFKDYNSLHLYQAFITLFEIQKTNYFDDVAISVVINYLADSGFSSVNYDIDESSTYANPTKIKILEFDKVLIDSVSQVQFSHNTENQIAEFTVQFKAGQFL